MVRDFHQPDLRTSVMGRHRTVCVRSLVTPPLVYPIAYPGDGFADGGVVNSVPYHTNGNVCVLTHNSNNKANKMQKFNNTIFYMGKSAARSYLTKSATTWSETL